VPELTDEQVCRTKYPDAYVMSQPLKGITSHAARGRRYYIQMPDPQPKGPPGRVKTVAEGISPEAAWASLRRKINWIPEGPESKSLERIFAKRVDRTFIDYVREDCVVFRWSEKGRGFGEYAFCKGKDGKWSIDNECDGRSAVKRVLCRLVDSLPLQDRVPEWPT